MRSLARALALTSLRQFNRKTFHAAGQCYWDANHRCSVMVLGIHFGPGGNHIDRSEGEQHGSDHYSGYVGHGLVPLSLIRRFKNWVDRAKNL
jgi:hypothetical protein